MKRSHLLSTGIEPVTPSNARRRSASMRAVWVRVIHAGLFGFSIASAWGLGLAISSESLETALLPALFAALVLSKVATFELFRLHRCYWRWFGLPDAAGITVANTSGSVLAVLVLGGKVTASVVAALLVIDWLVSQGLLLGSRMLYRMLTETIRARPQRERRKILILGAGRRGWNLLRQIRSSGQARYEIVGFIDDDPAKLHLMMQMTPILGTADDLPRLARLHQVEEVLVAIRSPTPAMRRRIQTLAQFADLRCRFARPSRSAPRRSGNARRASSKHPGVQRDAPTQQPNRQQIVGRD